MIEFKIKDTYITLTQFLKVKSLIDSGGQVSIFLQNNQITLNGLIINEKRKKIYVGDFLMINDEKFKFI